MTTKPIAPNDGDSFQWHATARRGAHHVFKSVLDLSPTEYAQVISAGVPASVVDLACRATGLAQARVCLMLGIPRQTLLRQLARPPGTKLGQGEGDAVADLCRFIGLIQLGAGQGQQALLAAGRRLGDWFKRPHDGLAGKPPQAVMACGVGRAHAFLLLKAEIAHGRLG